MEDMNIESGNIEEVADPQAEIETTEVTEVEQEVNPEASGNTEDVANPQQEQTQSAEDNARFAAMRREAERQAAQQGRDELIASQNYMDLQGNPITTEEHYNRAIREQEIFNKAKEAGQDPQQALRVAQMEQKIAAFERERMISEQERTLMDDPIRSEIYSENKSAIQDMANSYGVDLNSAYTVYLEQNFSKIIEARTQKAVNEALSKVNQNENTPGSLNNISEQPKVDFENMTSEEFEAYKRNILG